MIIVIEIVDTSEKIEQFMPIIDDAIKEGLATLEKATIRFYRGGNSNPDKPVVAKRKSRFIGELNIDD